MYNVGQIIKGTLKESNDITINFLIVEMRPDKYNLINMSNYVSVKYWNDPFKNSSELDNWISNNVNIDSITSISEF